MKVSVMEMKNRNRCRTQNNLANDCVFALMKSSKFFLVCHRVTECRITDQGLYVQ